MIFSLLYSQLSVQGYAGTTCYKVPNEQPRPMCRASFCNIFGQACCSHILCVIHSPGIFHTSCTTLTSSDVRYCLNHICPQCLILCCRITIIIIIVIIILHNPLRFFLWEFSAMSQQQSYSLKTSHFPQDMGSTKDG